jgi:hypothetical protein
MDRSLPLVPVVTNTHTAGPAQAVPLIGYFDPFTPVAERETL